MNNSTPKGLLTFLILIVIGVLAWGLLNNMPDHRSTGQRVGDAIDTLPEGPDKAVGQLHDRTPLQKMGDQIKSTTDDK